MNKLCERCSILKVKTQVAIL